VHDDQPTEQERRALAAWTPAEPPHDFADRVVAAAAVHEHVKKPRDLGPSPLLAARWPRFVAAAIAAAALAGAALTSFKYWPGAGSEDTTPARATVEGNNYAPTTQVLPKAPDADKPAELQIPADLKARLDAHIASYGAKYGPAFKYQGSLVVARRGEVLYSGNFGFTDVDGGRPISDHTRFKIGSLTQQFTAVAILQLRDEGKLSLDDAVTKHLPDFPHKQVKIRHLLTHTSGVPSYTDGALLADLKPGKPYPATTVRALFDKSALEFPPGTDFDLSNSGYFLLGQVIEALSKKPLADHLRARIFSPAAMPHTSLGGERSDVPGAPLASGHEFSEEELLVPVEGLDLATVYGGAAGILSTPADMVRWDLALHTPGALLSQASLDEMFTPVRDDYGLGWISTRTRGQSFVGHPGGVEGFNGAISRYLGDGITVIALANTEAVDCRDIVEDTSELIYGGAPPAHVEHDETPVSPAMLSRYLGDFTLSEDSAKKLSRLFDTSSLGLMSDVKVYDDDGRLFLLIPMHGAKWLHRTGEDRFFFKDPAGTTAEFGPPGAIVETLTLRQRGLEFVLRKQTGESHGGVRVTPGAYRNEP